MFLSFTIDGSRDACKIPQIQKLSCGKFQLITDTALLLHHRFLISGAATVLQEERLGGGSSTTLTELKKSVLCYIWGHE